MAPTDTDTRETGDEKRHPITPRGHLEVTDTGGHRGVVLHDPQRIDTSGLGDHFIRCTKRDQAAARDDFTRGRCVAAHYSHVAGNGEQTQCRAIGQLAEIRDNGAVLIGDYFSPDGILYENLISPDGTVRFRVVYSDHVNQWSEVGEILPAGKWD